MSDASIYPATHTRVCLHTTAFRIQELGWRNEDEYAETYGVPDRWEESGFIKAVRVKETGYIVYWRKYRECEDKYVNRVKLFSYE